mmetsp:Transcript_3767/g.5762  ORF Transcript_3767/g.5762 Transcript_3767/m.5762 type:complete len:561 (+) Transcript_3767:167-1849(+)
MIRPIILLLACRACSSFTSVSRVNSVNRPLHAASPRQHSIPTNNFISASTTYSSSYSALHASVNQEESSSSFDNELNQRLESNNLQKVISHLQSNAPFTKSLNSNQLQSIFDAIEVATVQSDENTVNKRSIEDATISSAVEFRALDKARAEMSQLYQLLREEGKLRVFGAIGRLPPSSLQQQLATAAPSGPIYPTSGSKIITPKLLETVTSMEMASLTPQPTNFLLYGGAILASLEAIVSLVYGINFNFLVVTTLLLALADQILVSGAVFETALRIFRPEMTTRITKHEAGHFLCAYLLGCPVEGVVLSTWAALQDGRFAGRAGSAVSAGTSYYDTDLSEQIAGLKPLTRDSIDRYSIIVMGGVAAEAMEYGRADGGAGDEEALVRFLRSLNPRSNNAVAAWTPELIRNQARWGATQAVLLMKEYKPCYDALVDALERGGDLGQCVVAIEEAAEKNGLGWLRHSSGTILEEGDYGKWVPYSDEDAGTMELNSGSKVEEPSSVPLTNGGTNGVPTLGEDPITEAEEFLKMYKENLTQKLETIDKKLNELDNKSSSSISDQK